MSFFPDSFDPRDPILGGLDLCEMDTQDGPARFMIGADGLFTDKRGRQWAGSQLIAVSSLGAAIGGAAPEGSITLSYFQDPNADDLAAQVRALGVQYVAGRPIRFYFQPIRSHAEFYAPELAPIRWMQRTMRTITIRATGAQNRSITLGFEAWAEDRRAARRIVMNTTGHAQLIGRANPSLSFIPTNDLQDEKLYG